MERGKGNEEEKMREEGNEKERKKKEREGEKS